MSIIYISIYSSFNMVPNIIKRFTNGERERGREREEKREKEREGIQLIIIPKVIHLI